MSPPNHIPFYFLVGTHFISHDFLFLTKTILFVEFILLFMLEKKVILCTGQVHGLGQIHGLVFGQISVLTSQMLSISKCNAYLRIMDVVSISQRLI